MSTNNVINANSPLFLLSYQTASSSANIAFTSVITSAYTTYLVILTNVVPATNTAILQMQGSSNNGGAWVSTGYLAGVNSTPYNSSTFTNTNSTTYFPLSAALSNTASNGLSAQIYLYNSGYNISGLVSFKGSTSGLGSLGLVMGSGVSGNNAINFLMSSGNISVGTFSLYGIKE